MINTNDYLSNFLVYAYLKKPTIISCKNDDDFYNIKAFSLKNRIDFIDNFECQVEEYKEIFTKFYQENSSLELSKNIVYFPWNGGCFVTILEKDKFLELLTWRNKNKITQEEQQQISSKCIGIAGCSVGSSAAKTLAKLGFQKFKMAEIKNIKPSNTSRIYADSIKGYGMHKLDVITQSMYEYNPYLEIETYYDGCNEHNLDNFFNGARPIDCFLDAADDGITKLLFRKYCEKYSTPLVSGFDEKGAIIIHRYDIKPLLRDHNMKFSQKDLIELKHSNPAEYINKLLDFFPGGSSNLTSRQKDTLEKIQNNRLGGFSQLSWEASFFAGYISKAILEISLGAKIHGMRLIDLDNIICAEMT